MIQAAPIDPVQAARRVRVHADWLDLSQATIDEQLDTVHVAAVVGGQKQDGLRDLIGRAGTAQGYVANRALYELIDLLLRHLHPGIVARRWDNARTNGIHPYLALFQVHGPGARKRADRRLGRACKHSRPDFQSWKQSRRSAR